MRVAEIPLEDPRWCEFVASHPSADPFHLPAWASVIADCYGFDSFVLAVRDTDQEILAGAPVIVVRSPLGRRRWVSLPFTDHCSMLVRTDVSSEQVIEAVREHVHASRTAELEMRQGLPFTQGCFPVTVGHHQFIELPLSLDDLHIRKNHRNARNRAQRRGVRVVRGNSAEDVAAFYRLHTLTRRRLGVPVQPRRFFDLIADRLLSAGHGFVATAMLGEDAVASGVYLAHNGTLMAKFGASDPDMQDTGAGYLIDWEMMVAGCQEGYHTLDFGRTDAGADGLRLYKSGWGAVETPLIYTHLSEQPPASARPHAEGLSRRLISNSPIWVCRALGEIFYRWAA